MPDRKQDTDKRTAHEEHPPGQQVDNKIQYSNIKATDSHALL